MQKEYVRSLFDSIANRYDVLNHLLSGGIDFYWRRIAILELRALRPKTILDVATGTADLAIAALAIDPENVIGIDISTAMLDIGRRKISRLGEAHRITVEQGEVESLRFPDGSFDAAIVAFGVRNFENLDTGLSEMRRVLRQGGRIMVLEFSRPRSLYIRQLYFFYFKNILPLVGAAISKHQSAYRYLHDTVMQFPEGETFLDRLKQAGFTSVGQKRLTFGIATIYTGTK